eukprot:1742315-Rhodomonas_salina.1
MRAGAEEWERMRRLGRPQAAAAAGEDSPLMSETCHADPLLQCVVWLWKTLPVRRAVRILCSGVRRAVPILSCAANIGGAAASCSSSTGSKP